MDGNELLTGACSRRWGDCGSTAWPRSASTSTSATGSELQKAAHDGAGYAMVTWHHLEPEPMARRPGRKSSCRNLRVLLVCQPRLRADYLAIVTIAGRRYRRSSVPQVSTISVARTAGRGSSNPSVEVNRSPSPSDRGCDVEPERVWVMTWGGCWRSPCLVVAAMRTVGSRPQSDPRDEDAVRSLGKTSTPTRCSLNHRRIFGARAASWYACDRPRSAVILRPDVPLRLHGTFDRRSGAVLGRGGA